jgi:hypothetical protein
MKYLLISKQTAEQTLCDKVTIDGFDYYVSNELPKDNQGYWIYVGFNEPLEIVKSNQPQGWFQKLWDKGNYKTPIATNNPNIDIPKVVDEVEMLAKQNGFNWENTETSARRVFEKWYKYQETHPFSEEDADAYADAVMGGCLLRAKEWKLQQPKKVYYTQTTAK